MFLRNLVYTCEFTRRHNSEQRFISVVPEIGIRRVATNKDKDKLQKFGLYLNMYKEKWKREVIKYEEG
jgi:hypothetical protein